MAVVIQGNSRGGGKRNDALRGLLRTAPKKSPAKLQSITVRHICGNVDPAHISTSFAERQNLTMRMGVRRFTRLTNGFSKKIQNLQAAVALHFMHYNFVRIHQTLRVTPAMEAGITDRVWTLEEIIELI
jgi:hypothetical protein